MRGTRCVSQSSSRGADPCSFFSLCTWLFVQIGFFRLYSHEFDFKEMILSPRTGGYLDKKKKVWGQSAKKDRHLVSAPHSAMGHQPRGRGAI